MCVCKLFFCVHCCYFCVWKVGICGCKEGISGCRASFIRLQGLAIGHDRKVGLFNSHCSGRPLPMIFICGLLDNRRSHFLWCDGWCVQGLSTYSLQHTNPQLLAQGCAATCMRPIRLFPLNHVLGFMRCHLDVDPTNPKASRF